jgi:hypothetical protein
MSAKPTAGYYLAPCPWRHANFDLRLGRLRPFSSRAGIISDRDGRIGDAMLRSDDARLHDVALVRDQGNSQSRASGCLALTA